MDRITQEAYHRQRMLSYAEAHGVTETALRYKCSRKTVYKWKKRYNGSSVDSLKDQSRAPKCSPRSQAPWERFMVIGAYEKDKGGDKLVSWHECRQKGYSRPYRTFLKTIAKHEKPQKRKPKRVNKPYINAAEPGEKMQADVKYVPRACITDGGKYYQYTMVDECTRIPFRQMYNEHSTYSSRSFLREARAFFSALGIRIRLIQTDNGTEWTKALISNDPAAKTLWEEEAARLGIALKRIRIATPRHNGKVERQHRKDQQRFYRALSMDSLEDGRRQLERYNNASIHFPIIPLGYKSPWEVLQHFRAKTDATVFPLEQAS